MALLELYKQEELSFKEEFDHIIILLDRKSPRDAKLYFRVSADIKLGKEEVQDLTKHFEQVKAIQEEIFDSMKIYYAEDSIQTINKKMAISHAEFTPQNDGKINKILIFYEIEE